MVEKGLKAVNAKVIEGKDGCRPNLCGTFEVTLADACIVPQLFNARVIGVDLERVCPALLQVEKECKDHEWFLGTEPENQPDFE
mmetsp:Transcript_61019/g.72423  ORF Transcript_61019/g.72423 Transcript_61019/m.72423 type:complete len:84 (-) Transcript_61019:284-535(-)